MIVAVEDGKCRGERSNVSLSSRVPCECGSVPCEQSQGSQHEKRLRRDSEGLKVESRSRLELTLTLRRSQVSSQVPTTDRTLPRVDVLRS